jgi:pseudo-rSAM protein
MFESNKSYWLYIYPHVYCCIKDKQVLLYNTQDGESIEAFDYDVISLLQSLHKKNNMGAIYCEGEKLTKAPYQEFLKEFCQKKMGNIVDVLQLPEKPIQLMPVLNLQCDVEKLQKIEKRNNGENVLENLLELNLYLHTICKQDCDHCNEYFRQSLCCQTDADNNSKILDIPTLKNILSQIKSGVAGKLNLLGGNVFDYPYYNELAPLLSEYNGHVHIWSHYSNINNNKSIFTNYNYDVVVTFPLSLNLWKLSLKVLKEIQTRFHFYITDVAEYEQTNQLIEECCISDYLIHPVYIKTNQDFFENYVYTNREEVLQTRITFNRIFTHQKMNTNFFGKLFIFPNGDVYANINSYAIGNIHKDTVLEIVNNEMKINTAWRKIRDTAPCLNCLYQFICPSPSNYELVIGKANLCSVKN